VQESNLTDQKMVRTIGKKAQITIPKEIRDYYGLKEGDRVRFQAGKNGVLIVPEKLTEEDIRRAVEEANRMIAEGDTKGYKVYHDVEQAHRDILQEE